MVRGALSNRLLWLVIGAAAGYVLVAFAMGGRKGERPLRQAHEVGQLELPGPAPVDGSDRSVIGTPAAQTSIDAGSAVHPDPAISRQFLPERDLTARELLQKSFVDVALLDLPRDVVVEALVGAKAVAPEDAERMWANMVRGVAALRWETQQLAKQQNAGAGGREAKARADQELRQLTSGLVRDLPRLIRDGRAETRGMVRGPAVPPKSVLGTLRCGLVAPDRLRLEFVDPPCSLDLEISAGDLSLTQSGTIHAIASELLPGGRPARK